MENLLGEHSNLVNLDSLVQPKRGQASQPQAGAKNPFAEQPNPFQAAAAPKPSMNELRGGNQVNITTGCLQKGSINYPIPQPDSFIVDTL